MAFRKTFSALIFISLLAACGQQKTYNDDAKQNYAQEAQLKSAELAPATGDWCGNMYMTRGKVPFAVEISLNVLNVTVQAPASQDPTLVAQEPKLQGGMSFDVLDGASSTVYVTDPDLLAATGSGVAGASVNFSGGDYFPQNEPQVTLPYSVSVSGQAIYGEVQGDLVNGHFIGSWTGNSNRKVGTFDLQQNCSTGGAS
jgi:hypothetical protein